MNDNNPYRSPAAEPEAKKRPPKPPGLQYVSAGIVGFMAFGGVTSLLAVSVDLYYWILTTSVLSLDQGRRMLVVYALIASPVGLLFAVRALRAPESKWLFAVAVLLGIAPFILGFIGVAFFGLP